VFVELGYINAQYLVGGDLKLNAKRSERALEATLAPLGKPTLEACYGIYQLAVSTMVRAVKAVTSYRGRDPREFVLVAFGGNGPLVAAGIAEALGISRILIPPHPGVFSAAGLVTAVPGMELNRTLMIKTRDVSLAEINESYAELEDDARKSMDDSGHSGSAVSIKRTAELRYAGQAHELSVPIQTEATIADIETLFADEHFRTYGHKADSDPIELVNLKVFVTLDEISDVPQYEERTTPHSTMESRKRKAYFGSSYGLREVAVVTRKELQTVKNRAGPLIIEEYDSTCVVPPGFNVSIDTRGNIDMSALS
jgi:N-methylhydantoinase A